MWRVTNATPQREHGRSYARIRFPRFAVYHH